MFLQNSNKYSKKTVSDVSWGPKGEWWIRWTDGSSKWNGLSTECQNTFDRLQRDNWDVKHIVFGSNDEWLIRYDS